MKPSDRIANIREGIILDEIAWSRQKFHDMQAHGEMPSATFDENLCREQLDCSGQMTICAILDYLDLEYERGGNASGADAGGRE